MAARCFSPRITARAGGSPAAAAVEGWSVRALEARARDANASGPKGPLRVAARPALHPDQEEAAAEIAETLGAALGSDVRVRVTPNGRYRVELELASPEEATELAGRVGSGAAR